jgi:hypothetical protein
MPIIRVAAPVTTAVVLAAAGAFAVQPQTQQTKEPPLPKVVTPGSPSHPELAPSDAIVLFDGTSFDAWTKTDGKPVEWTLDNAKVKGSAMTCKPGSGSIMTKEMFGDMQIHIEFATPKADADAGLKSQARGNSGVYIQGRYEVQVLDSYQNETYPDGQCGAVYKQHAPLVNVCRAPGEWQTYDIVFTASKFDGAGKKTANARVTVIHNGVLIQNNAEITGPTGGAIGEDETKPGGLMLQDHGNFVQYRNIWVRKL